MLVSSVPATSAVEATATEDEQDDEDDQKCSAIHRGLLGRTNRARARIFAVYLVNNDQTKWFLLRLQKKLHGDRPSCGE
jgi:hypothetical protein